MIRVDTNAAQLARALNDLARDMPGALYAGLSKWAIQTGNEVRNGAPRVTGALKRSISGRATQLRKGPAAEIKAEIGYAPFVEFGTRRMRPRNYFFRRILGRIDDLTRILTDALARVTRQAVARIR